jgi:hypothetical protein
MSARIAKKMRQKSTGARFKGKNIGYGSSNKEN